MSANGSNKTSAKRRTSPERKRLPQRAGALRRALALSVVDEPKEDGHVDVVVDDVEGVARRRGAEDIRAEQLAQLRDEVLERALRGLGRPLPPQCIDEAVDGDDLARVEQEEGQQGAVLLPGQENLVLAVDHAQRSQQSVMHEYWLYHLSREWLRRRNDGGLGRPRYDQAPRHNPLRRGGSSCHRSH